MSLQVTAFEGLDDVQVVERVRAGETALFEILMRRHNQRVYRAARSVLRDEQEVEDVMQQSWVNAYAHLDQFAGRAKFSTWLTRIAVHEALSRVRRRGPVMTKQVVDEDGGEEREPMVAAGGPTPEHRAFAGEMRALLETAIDALPGPYRQVFVLREVEGLTTGEVAECMDLTEEAVKTRLHRARALLREELYAKTGTAAPDAFQFHLSRCDRLVAAVLDRIGIR